MRSAEASCLQRRRTDRQTGREGERMEVWEKHGCIMNEITLKGPSSCLELISHHIFGRTHWMTSYSSMSASSKGQSLSVSFSFYQDYLFILTFIFRVAALQGWCSYVVFDAQ